jgi:deoxycytidine triphosphate deaminase
MTRAIEVDRLEWSDDEADILSKETFEKDPFHKTKNKIPPSLLSATDIVAYVKATAMISPFTISKDKLKHASYEACIGHNAFIYGKSGFEKITLTADGYLRVPANEITFVESEVTFRLPRYIAARFNLQIKHVHRGLLLGTGPLVDPGFRGKLLVPLHNLTSEDYYLHKDDGFIWLEFTRTTYDEDRPEPYGNYPEYKKISDGRQWLHKASYNEHLRREIPIRSSIRPLLFDVERRSKDAVNIARRVQSIGYFGGIALFVSFLAIMLSEIYANKSFTQQAYALLKDVTKSADTVDIKPLDARIAQLERIVEQLAGQRGIPEEKGDESSAPPEPTKMIDAK